MLVAFGIVGVFCIGLIVLLQVTFHKDRSFSDYAVGGRSFGPLAQSMSFLNSWWPGGLLLSMTGMALHEGVVAFYMPIYSLLTLLLMYVMARRVWLWGATHDLRTQADLLYLRYGSRGLSVTTSTISLISLLPWLVLGFKGLGAMFVALSMGAMSSGQAIACGVVLILVRQVWTVRMGMRGLIISDIYQGLVAYVGGLGLLIGLMVWFFGHHVSLAAVPEALRALPAAPAHGSGGLFTVFSMIVTGMIGGWCWPPIFVRLYTARDVRSVLSAGVWSGPLSMAFSMGVVLVGLLALSVPSYGLHADQAWFDVAFDAGGPWVLGISGTVMLAASMGGVDAIIQAMGTQVANDILGAVRPLSYRASLLTAKGAMIVGTVIAATIAVLPIQHLSVLALLSYQGIIQVAVAQYVGLFWRRGNALGGMAGMICGFCTAVALELWVGNTPSWSGGISSGLIGLGVNALIYVLCAFLFPQKAEEAARVETVFVEDGRQAEIAPRARAVSFWMGANVVCAVAPPVYLAFGQGGMMVGWPVAVLYYLVLGTSVCLSLFAAYASDIRRGYFNV